MIHFKKHTEAYKLGLNLYRAAGGFVAVWAWYDPGTYTMTSRRFRLRLHMAPRILRSVDRWHVVEGYLLEHDATLVNRETLQDIKAVEDIEKRVNEPLAYIKPV
jgi:hypothetical protein